MGLGYETEHPFDDFPDAQTSTMPRDMQPVSIETLKKAMKELELLPKPDQWLVVDPHGRMYKGDVEQMTRVLLAQHPLLKNQMTFSRAE